MNFEQEQEDLDKIVKKLSDYGYSGLSEEEKRKLFTSKLDNPSLIRFDTKLEFILCMIFLLTLVIHGIQRIVLAQKIPIILKLNSLVSNNTANVILNIILGFIAVLIGGYSLISCLSSYKKNKIIFFYRKDDKDKKKKIYSMISLYIILSLFIIEKIFSFWQIFIEKVF